MNGQHYNRALRYHKFTYFSWAAVLWLWATNMSTFMVKPGAKPEPFKINALTYICCVEDTIKLPMENFKILNLNVRLIHFAFSSKINETWKAVIASKGDVISRMIQCSKACLSGLQLWNKGIITCGLKQTYFLHYSLSTLISLDWRATFLGVSGQHQIPVQIINMPTCMYS